MHTWACCFTSLRLKQSNLYFNIFEIEFEICQNNDKLLEQIQKLRREFHKLYYTHRGKKTQTKLTEIIRKPQNFNVSYEKTMNAALEKASQF